MAFPDPALVFRASLTSAQVLLPDSQASLISLLLEGHALLALATIMFAPGGIHQVRRPRGAGQGLRSLTPISPSRVKLMGQGQRSGRSEVDPQVLKMALAPYPKLKAALFPGGPRGQGQASDITVYHLLQVAPTPPPTGGSVLRGTRLAGAPPSGPLQAVRLAGGEPLWPRR